MKKYIFIFLMLFMFTTDRVSALEVEVPIPSAYWQGWVGTTAVSGNPAPGTWTDYTSPGYFAVGSDNYLVMPRLNGVSNVYVSGVRQLMISLNNVNLVSNTTYKMVVYVGNTNFGGGQDLTRVNNNSYCQNASCTNFTTTISGGYLTTYFTPSGNLVNFIFSHGDKANTNPATFFNAIENRNPSSDHGIRVVSVKLYVSTENSFDFDKIVNKQEITNQKLDGVNNSINNQTNEVKKQTDAINKQTDEVKKGNDFLMDDTAPNSDISGLGNVQGLFPPGPVDSLLNIPFSLTSIAISSLSGTCVPIQASLLNHSFAFPCFRETIYKDMPTTFINLVGLVPATFILISYFKYLYKKVDRAVSMNSNADDEWGVV